MDLLYVHKMLIYMLHLCAHLKLHIKRVLVDQIPVTVLCFVSDAVCVFIHHRVVALFSLGENNAHCNVLPHLCHINFCSSLSFPLLSRSLHRGRGPLCRPEQTPHHSYDTQLRSAARLEHL